MSSLPRGRAPTCPCLLLLSRTCSGWFGWSGCVNCRAHLHLVTRTSSGPTIPAWAEAGGEARLTLSRGDLTTARRDGAQQKRSRGLAASSPGGASFPLAQTSSPHVLCALHLMASAHPNEYLDVDMGSYSSSSWQSRARGSTKMRGRLAHSNEKQETWKKSLGLN